MIGPDGGEIVVAPGVRHGLAAVSDREARLRCLVSPARDLQASLEESAAATREGLFTTRGMPRGLRGARWAARFLKRYSETARFAWPPPIVQRALIAVLARDA